MKKRTLSLFASLFTLSLMGAESLELCAREHPTINSLITTYAADDCAIAYKPEMEKLAARLARSGCVIDSDCRVTKLYLGCRDLFQVPCTIVHFTHLKALYLPHNKLTELPASIGDLKNLALLDASYNQLTTIPPFLHKLEALADLNLSYNKITDVPGGEQYLCTINFTGNPFTAEARAIR